MSQFFFSKSLKEERKAKMLKYVMVLLTGEQTGKKYLLSLMINPEEVVPLKQKKLTKEEIRKLGSDTKDKIAELALKNRGTFISDLPDTDEFYEASDIELQAIERSKDELFKVTLTQGYFIVNKDIKYPEEWLRELLEELEGIDRRKVISYLDKGKELSKELTNCNPWVAINLIAIDPISFLAPIIKMFEAEKERATLRKFSPLLIHSLRDARQKINTEIASLEGDLREWRIKEKKEKRKSTNF